MLRLIGHHGDGIVGDGDYSIYVSAPGYASESLNIHVEEKSIKNVQFNLNGLPEITDYNIITGTIQSWFNPDVYIIEVESEVHDSDGASDISRVEIFIKKIDYRDTLNRQENVTEDTARFYKLYDDLTELNIESLNSLIGYPIYLETFDEKKAEDLFQLLVKWNCW